MTLILVVNRSRFYKDDWTESIDSYLNSNVPTTFTMYFNNHGQIDDNEDFALTPAGYQPNTRFFSSQANKAHGTTKRQADQNLVPIKKPSTCKKVSQSIRDASIGVYELSPSPYKFKKTKIPISFKLTTQFK